MRQNVWMTACGPTNPGDPDDCESGACCLVAIDGEGIHVRDSKLADSPKLTYTPDEWESLCGRIRAGEVIDWAAEFHPLVFDADEIAAFVRGVMSDRFEPVSA